MKISTFILIFAVGLICASARPQTLADQEKSQAAAQNALTPLLAYSR
jgi:hypothetical protein